MLGVRRALEQMLPHFVPLAAEEVALEVALGRVLAEDVVARSDQPPFDNSAMDGYAVRHADLARASLPVSLHVRAGDPPGALSAGSAARIFTGAPMPRGADTVVIQEHAVQRDGDVRFTQHPARGANVRKRASDLAAGAIAVASGSALEAGEIGLLASQDCATVRVHRHPRVAVVCTGDELRALGAPQRAGSIVNSNAYALGAQITRTGGEPWVLPTAPDDVDAITVTLREALQADVVLSVGGVSVGEHDHVGEAFARAGIERQFWKVAVKPGKPLLFATAAQTPVVGLPGNPVSAMVTFEAFVRPCLRRMAGLRRPFVAPLPVRLAREHRHGTGRLELARARLRAHDDHWTAELHGLQGSGSLPSMVDVDALVMLPADRECFEAGARVQALPLRPTLFQEHNPFPE